MKSALIKLAFKQVIDSTPVTIFEKNVLNNSYNEFLLKSQAYNPEGRFKTFTEMADADGRANSLHYKCGFVVTNHIANLKNKIPGITDSAGRDILFDTSELKIIESDITNKAIHTVALIYTTPVLTLIDNIGDTLLLSPGNKSDMLKALQVIEDTFLLKLLPGFNIVSYTAC